MSTETNKISFLTSIINTFRALGNVNGANDISEEEAKYILMKDEHAKELLASYNMATASELTKHIEEYVNKCEDIINNTSKLDLNKIANSNTAKKMRKEHDKLVKPQDDGKELSK